VTLPRLQDCLSDTQITNKFYNNSQNYYNLSMSYTGPAVLAAKHSNLAQALISRSNSLYLHKGYQALSPTFQDETVVIAPANGVTTPAFQTRVSFNLPKVSTLIGKMWIETTLSAGTDSSIQNGGAGFNNSAPVNYGPAGPAAGFNQPVVAYCKGLGDLIYDNHQYIYGNVQLQAYPGRFQALYRAMCKNDVNIEDINALVLGGLPPGKKFICVC
jgi:hypothetical protein